MAAAPLLRDRLSFLHRLPILLKGTSDDDVPCPGYLFEEIAKISHESLGSSQCLLEYLLSRLQSGSGRVKLKVLKIMLHLCGHGSSSFLLLLKRNSAFIQEAAGFTGPPDPLHGNSLYQKVRAAAQDLGSTLFSDTLSPPPPAQPPRTLPPSGMGSQSRPQSALQGFGYSKEPSPAGSTGEALLATLQKAAEVVASAVRPGPEGPGSQGPRLQGDAYQPAVTPSASHGRFAPGSPPPGACRGARAARHQPGQAGGGWDEQDSSPGSRGSCQENGRSRASGSGTWSGSDSPSGASGAPGDQAERVEAMALSDCQQELSLVRTVTQGPHPSLSPEEAQRFIRECGLLNCEAVLELLTRRLGLPGEHAQMRALGAIATLGCTDLLSQEHLLLLAGPRLQELSTHSPGPVTSKATKILRHLEASCRQHAAARRPLAEPRPASPCVGPADLLTDALPLAGAPEFLQPLSSVLPSPRGPAALGGRPVPALGGPRKAEPRLAVPRDQEASPEQGRAGSDALNGGPASGPGPSGSHTSLFAGMELVACPRLVEAGPGAQKPPQPPWTLAPRAAAPEPPGSEPSAFAFLNS
ncbi:AP-4 complex accessory subunit tepsin isoform X2 [Pipistrellus kuhlii]|uniref:AP-4 complex accessory subunit Tepsin n=1 Tax=Pipistrellus kuhlii TaxID=59472 RepID=A0A7J7SER8_PIPKU|nr:AP-4 complex accessory subunit tepsin isoform X2 [Pipistrellus kuhlii]KAF6286956.1 TEPSIN adaptor related protein complex 4 accessory protein [Pipistrellus kuhlii]